ncbi:MAG: hypothetical protein HZB61_05920 [Nitrospirae bacterium]|nr:hypothetical protein [Nitrospirota bacterium]
MDLEQVLPEEDLTRYILHKNHFSALHNRVKYAAFLPAPNGETSVFRISNLSDNEIWETGDKEVAQKRGIPLFGRADILASQILRRRLRIVPDDKPQRHANIIGWPEEKSEQKLIAIELAYNARLYIK